MKKYSVKDRGKKELQLEEQSEQRAFRLSPLVLIERKKLARRKQFHNTYVRPTVDKE